MKAVRGSSALTLVPALALLAGCTPFTKLDGTGKTLDRLNGNWDVLYVAGKPLEGLTPRPQIAFDTTNGTVSGFDGCNRFKGTYGFEGGKLKAKTAGTRMACTSDAARQASAAIADLFQNGSEVVDTAMFQGHVLMLRNATFEIRLGPAGIVK